MEHPDPPYPQVTMEHPDPPYPQVTMEHPDPVLTLRTAVPVTIGTLPYLKPPADEKQPVVESSTAALRLGAAYKHLRKLTAHNDAAGYVQ